MRAYAVTDFKTEPQLMEVPETVPQEGQVKLRMLACGLNFADLLMAKGTYQDTPNPPFSLGLEVCGEVVQTMGDVGNLRVGMRVAAFVGAGGLADFVVTDAQRCRPVPVGMSDEIAAGFQVAYGTSHLALARRARLQPAETLVVLGAAGGVGLTAVEIGAAMGATVIAVARNSAKLEVARATGAHHTIEASDDLTKRIKELGGADVIYDAVGGTQGEACVRALHPEGRYLVIGFASGDVPVFKANHLLVKNIDLMGFYWGGYLKFRPDALMDSLDTLMTWHSDGRLAPHISHSIPLERAHEALELLRTRTSTGKVVITP